MHNNISPFLITLDKSPFHYSIQLYTILSYTLRHSYLDSYLITNVKSIIKNKKSQIFHLNWKCIFLYYNLKHLIYWQFNFEVDETRRLLFYSKKSWKILTDRRQKIYLTKRLHMHVYHFLSYKLFNYYFNLILYKLYLQFFRKIVFFLD